jgi:uric acid-xanthine permease
MALLMGLQHAFAMVGGLITPPLVVTRFAICGFPFCAELEQYAISAALIASGVCSLIQVSKTPIPGTKALFGRQLYMGSGILSVMGTAFTFLPIFELSIVQMKNDGIDGRVAYGKMIGTSCVCTLLEIGMSLMPVKWLQTAFPPLVTSVTVMLIGVGLIGSGMKSWGGGVVCAEMGWKEHSQLDGFETDIPLNPSATCVNGEVTLGFGSAEYIGLGFSVVVGLVMIELFGSIFMKNCNVVIALLFGYIIASFNNVDGQQYVESSKIVDARWFTFLWVETFPIGFYAPALVPMLIAYFVTTVETLGTLLMARYGLFVLALLPVLPVLCFFQ